MPEPRVFTANLGPKVAAVTAEIHGEPAAVINTEAARSRKLRHEAALALVCAGLDAGLIIGALHGIRR